MKPRTESPEAFEEAFNRAFSLVAFITNRHIVDHMVRFRRAFGLDFEALVLWAVLAHQNCAHLFAPGSAPGKVLTEEGRLKQAVPAALRPVRLRHLSEITGIPRETTRRKLALLERQGWIIRLRQGWLVNPERVEPDLRTFTLETVRRFLSAAREVEQVLKSAERHPR